MKLLSLAALTGLVLSSAAQQPAASIDPKLTFEHTKAAAKLPAKPAP